MAGVAELALPGAWPELGTGILVGAGLYRLHSAPHGVMGI